MPETDEMRRTKARKEALPGTELLGDKTDREIELEKLGDINILQRYRLHELNFAMEQHPDSELEKDKDSACGHHGDETTISPFLLHRLFYIEEALREVIQREAAYQPIISKESIQKASEIRKKFDKSYWRLEQEWWQHYSSLVDGPQRRGFDLWRSNPKWYMHSTLVEDCAGRNGCCARGCGCCSRREPTSKRPRGVGHCTLECACCKEARGFDLSREEKEELKERYNSLLFSMTGHRIVRVAMWGLVGGIDKNPFDMIVDEPPSYTQAQAYDRCLEKPSGQLEAGVEYKKWLTNQYVVYKFKLLHLAIIFKFKTLFSVCVYAPFRRKQLD